MLVAALPQFEYLLRAWQLSQDSTSCEHQGPELQGSDSVFADGRSLLYAHRRLAGLVSLLIFESVGVVLRLACPQSPEGAVRFARRVSLGGIAWHAPAARLQR